MQQLLFFRAATILILTALFSLNLHAQGDNCLDYDGTDDNVSVTNASAQIASSASGFSLSCWVYATNPAPNYPNFDGIVGFRNESNADFYLLHLNTNSIEGRLRNSAGTVYTVNGSGFSINTWQHLVLSYNGSNLTMYINGVQAGTVAASGTISSSSESLFLGKVPFSATDFLLDGKLDEVALWTKGLTASEVTCMYNNGHDLSDPDLKLYYRSNQGVAGGNNSTIGSLTDSKGNINGQLNGFAKSGATSNFVAGVVQFANISASVCKGQGYMFGGNTYTQAGTYLATVGGSGSCDSIVQLVLSLDSVDASAKMVNSYTIRANLAGATYQWIDCATKQPIPGATMQSYSPAVTGSYAVVVSDSTCMDTSACFSVVNSSSISENALTKLHVYPDPASSQLTFSLGTDAGKGVLEIRNTSGTLVRKVEISEVETQLQLSLPGGIYLLTFTRDDGKRGSLTLAVD